MKLSKGQRIVVIAIGLIALFLEMLGVASGSYSYGAYPLKLFGVPLAVILGWIIVCILAYAISLKKGLLIGILAAYTIDLALEPLAYYLGLWVWTNGVFTTQIYFGSTVGNVIVWLTMLTFGATALRKTK